MHRKFLSAAVVIAFTALLLNFQSVYAHESITVGEYEIVYGWVNEPPIAGQMNGVEIFVNNTSSGQAQPAEEHIIHSLVVELSYGGETKILTLEPVFDAPGAFDVTIIPTIPGLYSLKFSGSLGETAVDTVVELEEVQAAGAVQFPSDASFTEVDQDTAAGPPDLLVWLSLALAVIGIGLATIALQRPSSGN